MAIGNNASAGNTSAIAIGNGANVTGYASVAIGNSTNATGGTSVVIGDGASSTQALGTALGRGATVTHQDSVALGASSATAAPVNTSTMTIAGKSYTLAGGTASGTVSIGSSTKKRTITNLAAGTVSATSTDAVNGSQLHAVVQAAESTATALTSVSTAVTSV